MHLGTDPNRATSQARRWLYRDPVRTADLAQVVLALDESVSTNTRAPSFHLSDMRKLSKRLKELKIGNIKIFAQDVRKTCNAEQATNPDNLLCRVVKEFRDACGSDLFIAVETCLCPYTEDGACGLHLPDGHVDRARTLELFAEMAVLHAKAGVDAVGPASMITGTVAACREALDSHSLGWVGLMPHLIFRSPFFSLYRSIMGTGSGESRPAFQIDPFNSQELLRTLSMLVDEGATSIISEPGLFVLDLVGTIKENCTIPVGCFCSSGEYEMLRYGSNDPSRATLGNLEFCRAAKRAGADFIATYAALEVAETLRLLEDAS